MSDISIRISAHAQYKFSEEQNVPNYAPLCLDLDQNERENPDRLAAMVSTIEARAQEVIEKPLKEVDNAANIYMVEYPVCLRHRSLSTTELNQR